MIELTTNLPSTINATLPANYEAARAAIAECECIDECKTWVDRAVAIASYVRQAKDDSLGVMARRIQARAVRRGGELLKLIEAQPGKRTDLKPSGDAPTRLQTATAAGMSKDRMVQSLHVADVPRCDFDAQVESPNPPTITQLAEAGTKRRQQSEDAEGRQIAKAAGAIRAFAEFCEKNDPRMLSGLSPSARADLQHNFSAIAQWLYRFVDADRAAEGTDDATLREL